MKKQVSIIMGILLLVSVLVINFSFISGQEASYCCEKTVGGAWCQDSPETNCDDDFRKAPTSCEATSYCRMGTCYNSQEGTCMENTPERVCEEEGGVWEDAVPEELGQCQLGCCLIGDQASFVTQTRCKRLSSLYGLETNFRTDISSELSCIASATSDSKGACVFDEEFERTCKFTTQAECSSMGSGEDGPEFYDGLLCSAETLGTNCGPTEDTICVEGRDEVYFVDTCGNLANIYDYSRIDDTLYWKNIYGKAESCGFGASNSDSSSCGNCDYFAGSTCKAFSRSEDKRTPSKGDFICRDLGCDYLGKTYEHGETWCAESAGVEDSLPGSRHFRLLCYDGDVTIEPCADYRQEVCLESDINDFSVATCRVNMWQDCLGQINEEDCENIDRRDCRWVGGDGILCLPQYAPGLDFWNTEGDALDSCAQASVTCTVTYEIPLTGGKDCVENCECTTGAWKRDVQDTCSAIGDCGMDINYIGVEGFEHSDIFQED